MTPEEAALSLRDDPTFPLMTRAEQESEAITLLGSDDPLDVALAVELALSPTAAQRREAAAIMAGQMEPCRLATDTSPGCGGREPVAGNGRCLTCGAYRLAPETPQEAPEPVAAPIVQPPAPSRPAAVPADLVERFKTATGFPAALIAQCLGVKRSTAQAYIDQRLSFTPTADQREGMRLVLERQRALIDALLDIL